MPEFNIRHSFRSDRALDNGSVRVQGQAYYDAGTRPIELCIRSDAFAFLR